MKRKKQARSGNYGIDEEVAAAAEAVRAIEFIESHLFDELSVARVAKGCAASAFHFSRRFSQRKGESVMSYVRGRRLEIAAKRLLNEPDTAVTDVAFDCRFESQAAFTRAFTRALGMSPNKYRRDANPRGRKVRSTMISRCLKSPSSMSTHSMLRASRAVSTRRLTFGLTSYGRRSCREWASRGSSAKGKRAACFVIGTSRARVSSILQPRVLLQAASPRDSSCGRCRVASISCSDSR
jgi:AraC-like DNA-binding protein